MRSYGSSKKNSFNSILQRLKDNRADFKKSHPDQISFYDGAEKQVYGKDPNLLVLQKALALELCIDHVLNGKLRGEEVNSLSEARLKKLYKWKYRLEREARGRNAVYGFKNSQSVNLGQIPSFNEVRQSKRKPKEGLRDLLLWLLSPKKVKILKLDDPADATENNNTPWSEFEIYDSLSPALGADLNFNDEVPFDSKLVALMDDATNYFPSKKLSSYDFWHIYLHVSGKLNEESSKSVQERQEDLIDTALKKILVSADKLLLPKLKRDELRNEVRYEAAKLRLKKFKDYINQDVSSEKYSKENSYKTDNFRWSYKDTINRGIYHTKDGWIERNVFARSIMVISGLDPYSEDSNGDTGMVKSPAMKCAFELKAVLYEMEGKVARWHAKGKYTSSLKIVSKHLRELVDLFILFDKLHHCLKKIESGAKEQPIVIEESSQGRRKEDLISLNDIALLTSIQPKTILNEAKVLKDTPVKNSKFAEIINESEELCWELYKDGNAGEDESEERIISMLDTVEKNEIHPNDRESFDSRCYSMRSVIRWIQYKQYDLSDSGAESTAQKVKIPLRWEQHDKEFDLGLKELF